MVSVKDRVRSRILNDMLRAVQPPGRWKVLVVDAESLKVINSACTMSDILDENVTSVEDIARRRQPYPDREAIYFIGPSNDSVQLIIDDFTKSKPLYAAAHIFCTAVLPDRLFDRIKSSPANKFTKRLVELNVDFIGVESHVFSLDNPTVMHAVYNAPTPSHLDFELKNLAARLTSVLATLGEYPYIRYHDPAAGSKGQPIAAKLAQMVRTELDNLCDLDPSFPPKSNSSPATLIILDRSIDVIAPLLHEHTYQAMANDLIPLENNKYIYGDEGEEQAILDESDVLWAHTRHWHIAEVMEFLGDVVQKFISSNKAANWEMSKNDSNASLDKLQQMKETMTALPQYQEMKKKFSIHTNLCQEIMAVYKRRQLEKVTKVEQDFATELDTRGAKISMMELNPILEDKNVRYLDKIRLLMLFIISQEGIQESERQRLFELVRIGQEETQAVNNLSLLGVRLSASMEKKKSEKGRYTYGGGLKEKSKEEPKFDTMRYTPVLKYVMEDQAKGVIDSNYFPWIKEPPSDYQGYGTKSSRTNSSMPTAEEVRRNTKPSWATRKANGTPTSRDSGLGGSGTSENRTSMSLESLMNSMRGGLKSADLRANGSRIIVFVMGGITFSEMRACAEVIKSETREVIIGSTHVCNPKDFLDVLKTLHRGNASAAATSTPTPRMPGNEVLAILAPPPIRTPPVTSKSPPPSIARSTTSRNGSVRDSPRDSPRMSEASRPVERGSPRPLSPRQGDRVPERDTRDRSQRDPMPRDERSGRMKREDVRDGKYRDNYDSGNSYRDDRYRESPKFKPDDRYRPEPRYRDETMYHDETRYREDPRHRDEPRYRDEPKYRDKPRQSDDRGYQDNYKYRPDEREPRIDNSRRADPYARDGYRERDARYTAGIESDMSQMRMDSGGPDPYQSRNPMTDSKEMSRKPDSATTSKSSWWKRGK